METDFEYPLNDADPLLQALFTREQCPHPDQLLDYQLMRLDLRTQNELRTHLSICDDCTRELAQLTELDTADAPIESVQQASQLNRLLKRLRQLVPNKPILPAIWQPTGLSPAMALRGKQGGDQSSERRFVYQVGDYRISLAITSMQPAQNGYQIEGEVIDLRDPDLACEGSVRLFDGDQEQQLVALDELSFFVMENIQQASGSLLIELTNHSLWVQEIRFAPQQS